MIIKRCIVCGKRITAHDKTTRTCGKYLCRGRWEALSRAHRRDDDKLTPAELADEVRSGRLVPPLSMSILSTALIKAIENGRAEEEEEIKALLKKMPKPEPKKKIEPEKLADPKPTRICHGWTDSRGKHHACAHRVRTWDYQCTQCRTKQRAAYDVPLGMDDSEVGAWVV